MPLNLKSMCRLCMSNQGVSLYDIFSDDTDQLDPKEIFQENLATRIQTVMNVEVSVTDGFSRYACFHCIYSVNRFYIFRENCLEALFRTKKILEAIDSKEGGFGSCNMNDGEEVPILVYESCTSGAKNAVDPLALPDEIREEPDVKNCLFTPKNNDLMFLPKNKKSSTNKEKISSTPKCSKSPAKKPRSSQPKGGVTTVCNSTEVQGNKEDIPSSSQDNTKLSVATDTSKTGVPLKYEEHPCGRPNPSSYIKYPEMPTEDYVVHLQSGSYACQACGKIFNHKSSLKRHYVTHTNAKPYQCKFCEKYFTDSSNLVKHIRYMHNTNKRVVCSSCKKEFRSPNALALHKDRVHKKPKKDQEMSTTEPAEHKCDACPYTGASASELMAHKNTHYSEPGPSSSAVKETGDVTEASINHVTAALTETSLSDAPAAVNEPSRNAAAAASVTDFSSDFPIVCQICLSSFQDNESLDAHKTLAHEVHKFQCPHCPEGFMLKKKYEKHIKAVHDSTEYKCGICSKTFSSDFSCNLHLQTHSSSRLGRATRPRENLQCEYCREPARHKKEERDDFQKAKMLAETDMFHPIRRADRSGVQGHQFQPFHLQCCAFPMNLQ